MHRLLLLLFSFIWTSYADWLKLKAHKLFTILKLLSSKEDIKYAPFSNICAHKRSSLYENFMNNFNFMYGKLYVLVYSIICSIWLDHFYSKKGISFQLNWIKLQFNRLKKCHSLVCLFKLWREPIFNYNISISSIFLYMEPPTQNLSPNIRAHYYLPTCQLR